MTARRPTATGSRSRHLRPRAFHQVVVIVTAMVVGTAIALVALADWSTGSAPVTGARPQAVQRSQVPERPAGKPGRSARLGRPAPGATAAESVPAAPGAGGPGSAECTVDRLLVPSCGAWWGAAISEFPQHTALRAWELKIGRPVAIYHNYYAGRAIFPSRTDLAIARERGRNRMLLLSWKPDRGETWAQVANGSMDDHIDKLAAHFKTVPERFWLVIHHEPENEIVDRPGSGYTATDFRDMFRHVVQRLRARGVRNAVYTMMYMAYSGYVVKPWFKQLYPGNDVVDWIGYDAYAFATTKTFSQLVDQAAPAQHRLGLEGFYTWAERNLSADKPMMLGEWGGSELSGNPADKAALFRSLAAEIHRFPRLRALVYWDSPNGPKFGDTRVDTTPQSLRAYQEISRLRYFNPTVPTD